MNTHAVGKRALNLGSGIGQFAGYLNPEIDLLNLDIDFSKPNLHLVADAHRLPFSNESFDIVFSIAVLEHVRKPWIVSDEINRILRTGGYVVLELPFLNIIHDKHDYFRFTDKGIKSLFDEDRYEEVLAQVSAGGASFLSVFLWTYFEQFLPGRHLKKLWSILMRYPFSLVKYFDILTNKSSSLRITANSFSFIGKKR